MSVKSPIKWVGGKRREIKHFEKYIPKHDIYIEPFFGGGALYWHMQPKKAIINDVNSELINFYEVLKFNYSELIDELQHYILSKEFFNDQVIKLNNQNFTSEIERASTFYYLNKTSFSGKWRLNSKGKYNNTWGNYKKENYKSLDFECSKSLKDTTILNGDYKQIFNTFKHDENTFMFLDPPYLDCDSMYTDNQDFTGIYDYLSQYIEGCNCKMMLVVKGNNLIRELFHEYIKDEYKINYSHNAKSNLMHNHLIITNY
jgi:DNA adenine methylase